MRAEERVLRDFLGVSAVAGQAEDGCENFPLLAVYDLDARGLVAAVEAAHEPGIGGGSAFRRGVLGGTIGRGRTSAGGGDTRGGHGGSLMLGGARAVQEAVAKEKEPLTDRADR